VVEKGRTSSDKNGNKYYRYKKNKEQANIEKLKIYIFFVSQVIVILEGS
jgi:hypothetical protein